MGGGIPIPGQVKDKIYQQKGINNPFYGLFDDLGVNHDPAYSFQVGKSNRRHPQGGLFPVGECIPEDIVASIIFGNYKLYTRKNISYTISNNVGDRHENHHSTAVFQAIP